MKKILLMLLLTTFIFLSCGEKEEDKSCTLNSDCETNYCEDNLCKDSPCTETCDKNAQCTKLDGENTDWECKCDIGYLGDGVNCEVDKCKDLTCHTNAECKINDSNEAECECKSGYSGDGTTWCKDFDECLFPELSCPEGNKYHHCTNNPGAPPTCIDKNECEINNGDCGDVEKFECINNDGAPVTCIEK